LASMPTMKPMRMVQRMCIVEGGAGLIPAKDADPADTDWKAVSSPSDRSRLALVR
jgi:hypothetical protein